MYSNKQQCLFHQKPLTRSALSELGLETKAQECSRPCGTIDMGREAEECKHVFNMKVSFRSVLAVIVFQVPILEI